MQVKNLLFAAVCALSMGAKRCPQVSVEVMAPGLAAPLVTGADVVDARLAQHAGQNDVALQLSDDAARRFATYTAAHLGTRLAIVVDGVTMQEPLIRDAIKGGSVMVSGLDEARARALVEKLHCTAK